MASRRSRPQYRHVTTGYRASRRRARSPRHAGLTRLRFRSVLRFLFGFHPTRPHGKGRFRLSPVPASCSCLRFMVASSWLHTGLAPAAIHPCQAHPVALRAPSDPADVILSINVLIYDPPPPSTLISSSGLSQGCWHRGVSRIGVGSTQGYRCKLARSPVAVPSGSAQAAACRV